MKYVPFSSIDLNNVFFDSLKADYKEFPFWFQKKQKDNSKAYLEIDSNNKIFGFLYLKIEEEEVNDINPNLPKKKRIKVGTFKVDAHGTKFGERFIKKIVDYAITENIKEIYLTVFPKHEGLISLLTKYGFKLKGEKKSSNGIENVYVKDLEDYTGDTFLDYPRIQLKSCNKYLLSIRPLYHTRLFPDSILNNETYDIIQDFSATNSIHKIYICFMNGCRFIKPKDLLLIYRTSDGAGAARFRSVVTSCCEVQETKTRSDFKDKEDFVKYSSAYSIFAPKELEDIWDQVDQYTKAPRQFYVIKMTYNAAFQKRITNGALIDMYGLNPIYWGFFELTDEQFEKILNGGKVNENIIIDKA